jgi:peptidylprolyl isomerase
MKHVAAALALCLALPLAACGEGDSSPDLGESKSERSNTTPTGSASETGIVPPPEVQVPAGPPPNELTVDNLRSGKGPGVKASDEVTIKYVGVEYETGEEVESTWDSGAPLSFRLGAGEVIPGWERGVLGMKIGGRRRLIVPSDLAYGSGTLVFLVDLVAINGSSNPFEDKSNFSKVAGDRAEPKIRVPSGPPPKQVVIKDLVKGTGAVVEPGDQIRVKYIEANYKTGKVRGNSWEIGQPTVDNFGTGEVVAGWEVGLKGMKVGGRRELIVPSKLAYGEGALIYVIDLLGITPRPD